MGKFFSIDSPFYRFASKLTDILILNLLWILCSIPIVTIGASTTAIYYVSLKMVKNEEEYIVKSFFHSFKQNFKQSTIMWLIFLVFGVILGTDYYYLFNLSDNPSLFLKGITVLASILYVFCILYAFPLIARYENTIGRTIMNSVAISIRYIFRTIIIILMIAVLTFLGFYSTTTLFFALMFGVGVVAFVVSAYVMKIFENLEVQKQKWDEEHGEQILDENAEDIDDILNDNQDEENYNDQEENENGYKEN